MSWPAGMSAVSVYVHFPWCTRKCPYCDFNSHPAEPAAIPHEAYADAVCDELTQRVPRGVDAGLSLVSIFFGGGTPSLWDPLAVRRVIGAICDRFGVDADSVEITLECNPSILEVEHARQFRDAGVNRLSVGVQSTREHRLRFLGRSHTGRQALDALEQLRPVIPRLSADLIFATPESTAEEFCHEVDEVLDTGVDHVSAYSLTIEPRTQFGELFRKGRLAIAPDDLHAEVFLAAHDRLTAAGLEHYEISNYARPGCRSVHNQHYWRARPYVGLGAGAVGCVVHEQGRRWRYRNEPLPHRFMSQVGRGAAGLHVAEETLNDDEWLNEALMMGLRTVDGVECAELERFAGAPTLARRSAAIERAVLLGHLACADGRWVVPFRHWLHLDSVVCALFE